MLTSELTASAAEIFVLSLLQHPRLTLIGEPTQGILSDTLERHLPNGWLMGVPIFEGAPGASGFGGVVPTFKDGLAIEEAVEVRTVDQHNNIEFATPR